MSSSDAAGPQSPSKHDISSDAVTTVPPRPEEASGIEERARQPPANESNFSIDTESQPHYGKEKASSQRNATAFPPLLDEIRFLRERLLHLEDRAARQWGATVEDAPREASESGEIAKSSGSDDDGRLRNYIRRAPSSRRRVQRIEQQAEELADERIYYGQDPNRVSRSKSHSTMYHIRPSGEFIQGNEFQALAGTDGEGWFQTHGYPFPRSIDSINDDIELRQRDKPYPRRGVRPLTAVHPFYEAPIRKGGREQELPPLRLSRKLGPPAKWDETDSEEWSSDTSTRSQDFKYFRARLRGDFEWELDRLNAQVLRYKKHQDKKKSRQLAMKTQEDSKMWHEEFGDYTQHGDIIEKSEISPEAAERDQNGFQQLNLLPWSAFRVRRALPLPLSFVIDVLIEEPKLSSEVQSWGRSKKEKKDKKVHKTDINIGAPTAEDSAQSSKESTAWTAQKPLPERIRINSKQIIGVLSSIHGSPLCPDADDSSSVQLLRPFRILNAYDREIRETCSRLESGAVMAAETSTHEGEEDEKQQVKSDTGTDEKSADRPPASVTSNEIGNEDKKPISQEEQSLQLKHLNCLRQFMDEYIGRKVSYLHSVNCTKIFFSDMWHLFQPGTTVISADGKQAYRVVSLRSKRHKGTDRWDSFWSHLHKKKRQMSNSSEEQTNDTKSDITIKCIYIHFDGEAFGPVTQPFHFNKWDGEKEITYLDIYPLRFHVLKHLDKRSLMSSTKISASVREQEIEAGVQVLRHKLIDRGRVFHDVASVKQMYYSGLTVDTRDEVESQVMVDFEEALASETSRGWIPRITRLLGTDWNSKTDESDEGCTAECCWQENVHDDAYVETNNTEKFIDDMMAEIKDEPHKLPSAIIFPRSLEETKTESNAWTDDELMIMSYCVFGFILRDRTWAKLDLDCMSAVRAPGSATEQTDDELEEGGQGAFGQLVLPSGHKKMVLSLISQHFRNKESHESNDKQVDIVRGKGKGLIILLHGAPGVGKTTTAEGVAETFGQPLFQITCGDLGSNPKDVEAALQTNFALANRWGCILLLDEADVFLAERRREDFNRNGLVAVFLRVLEYYAGILFLTTNRIGDFDEAFASRIHMSLHYPALDEVSTAKVFRLNLGLIKARLQDRVKIQEDEIITAAGKHWREHKHARWNGRQIRNACQTALALAEFDAQPKGKKYDIKEKTAAKIYLKLSHLEIVTNAYLEFTNYLKDVYGTDAEGRAKESGLRALDTLFEALKSERREGSAGEGRSPSRQGHAGRETPFQSFRLRSGSSGQRTTPGMAAPPSPEPAIQHDSGHHGFYSPQRHGHELPSAPAQRMQYNQGAYTGNQSAMGDMRGSMHPAPQQVQPGTYLQPPQNYSSVGHGHRGQYQTSDQYMHDNQPLGHTGSYPSPPTSAASGGPASGGASLGRFEEDQSRQGYRGGQAAYDESEQM